MKIDLEKIINICIIIVVSFIFIASFYGIYLTFKVNDFYESNYDCFLKIANDTCKSLGLILVSDYLKYGFSCAETERSRDVKYFTFLNTDCKEKI